jgi:hypothetical protein
VTTDVPPLDSAPARPKRARRARRRKADLPEPPEPPIAAESTDAPPIAAELAPTELPTAAESTPEVPGPGWPIALEPEPPGTPKIEPVEKLTEISGEPASGEAAAIVHVPIAAGVAVGAAPRVSRPVVFLYDGSERSMPAYWEALAAGLRAQGIGARALPAGEVAGLRDATVVFPGATRLWRLARARLAGHRVLLDAGATPRCLRRPGMARFVDGVIFRTRRQRVEFDRPGWVSRVIYDGPEPGLGPHAVAAGEFRIACFASSASSELFGRIPGVAFIACAAPRHAAQFNCHLALPAARGAALPRPGYDVANAAACGAVLVTPPDAAAVELLGEDYPFFCAPGLDAVAAAVARARQLRGGPEWRRAVDLLARAAAETRLETVVEQTRAQLAELESSPGRGASSG